MFTDCHPRIHLLVFFEKSCSNQIPSLLLWICSRPFLDLSQVCCNSLDIPWQVFFFFLTTQVCFYKLLCYCQQKHQEWECCRQIPLQEHMVLPVPALRMLLWRTSHCPTFWKLLGSVLRMLVQSPLQFALLKK